MLRVVVYLHTLKTIEQIYIFFIKNPIKNVLIFLSFFNFSFNHYQIWWYFI